MFRWLNKTIDRLSEFLAPRKGLLPLIGVFMVIINLVIQFFPAGWIKDSNFFLHLGIVVAILGLMLAWVL
jgi:hypothetical protein